MKRVAIDGHTEIAYRETGDGSPTVLVHGWMASGRIYDQIAPLLDGRVIVPDLRGTGASTTRSDDESIARLGHDVIAVADAAGASRFALVGHSMGGVIAQWIASEVPDRVTSLVLVNPVPASGLQLPPEADALFFTSGADRGKQGAILDMACKELAEHDKAAMLDDAGAIDPARIGRMYRAWSGASFAERLACITARTLVIATDDPFLPPDFLRAAIVDHIKGATMQTLSGPGHYSVVERSTELAAMVRGFLAQGG
jgi:pimeloyl-ACP methyl ester carboxylesterase